LELHRVSFGFIGILLFFSGERSRLLHSTFSQINEWRVHLNLHAIFILFSVVAKALLWLILTFFWRIDLQRRTRTTYNDERFMPMTTIAPAQTPAIAPELTRARTRRPAAKPRQMIA
jgi:hypothetical protein